MLLSGVQGHCYLLGMSTGVPALSPLAEPLTLPCGLTLPNRLYKAAMAETLAAPNGDPSDALIQLYRLWADSGAGMLITGDIGVNLAAADATAVRLHGRSDLAGYARWAEVVHARDVRLFGQIFHMGRQASRTVAWRPIAPSATPPVLGLPLFGASRALTTGEIAGLIGDFAAAAGALQRAGFDGVEVHAAHGFLVGSFLSPFSNRRTDDWGGNAEERARFLLEVIRAIRSRVDPGFAVAVKINASDFRRGGLEVTDSAHIVGLLDGEGVDLVEISGGTFESTTTALQVREEDPGISPDAYFASFAPRLREMTSAPLALVGGLRSGDVMAALVRDGVVDAVGLARPMVEFPDAPRRLLHGETERLELSRPPTGSALNELSWYTAQFHRLGAGRPFDPALSGAAVARAYARSLLRQLGEAGRRTIAALPGR